MPAVTCNLLGRFFSKPSLGLKHLPKVKIDAKKVNIVFFSGEIYISNKNLPTSF